QRLESEKPGLDTTRAALERDGTARPVVEGLRRRDTASAQAASAVEALAQLASSTRALHPELVDLLEGEEPAEQLVAAADEATAAAGALQELVELEQALPARAQQLAARREQLTAATTALTALTEQLEARPARRTEQVTARDAARTAAAALGDARLALRTAEERQQAVTAAATQQKKVEAAHAKAAAALRTAQERTETET